MMREHNTHLVDSQTTSDTDNAPVRLAVPVLMDVSYLAQMSPYL